MHHHSHSSHPTIYGTTILAVRHKDAVVVAGDGQVTQGAVALKHNANKLRTLAHGKVLAGFAGSTADAFVLCERLEAKLEEFSGQLPRACVELARDWRSDRYLRKLEAMLLAVDAKHSFMVSGVGDVIEPQDNVMAIGSGGGYALAAARALVNHSPSLTAQEIVHAAMAIAADLCVYTNDQLQVLSLPNQS